MREESKSCSILSNLLVDKNTLGGHNGLGGSVKMPVVQELSKNNNIIGLNTHASIPEESINNIGGFPVYLLIIITILTNLFIAIILTPVLSVGILAIIFLIVILSMLLLYIISELL
jgi:hypothetical protein